MAHAFVLPVTSKDIVTHLEEPSEERGALANHLLGRENKRVKYQMTGMTCPKLVAGSKQTKTNRTRNLPITQLRRLLKVVPYRPIATLQTQQ